MKIYGSLIIILEQLVKIIKVILPKIQALHYVYIVYGLLKADPSSTTPKYEA
jgi:hypothetical protein